MKTTQATRIHVALLALLAAAGTLTACGQDAKQPDQKDTAPQSSVAAPAETEPLDSLSARRNVSDDVPELDFGGREYRIFYQKRYTNDAIAYDIDEVRGDVLNDAVYDRNAAIAERFNIKITGIEGEEEAMVANLMNTVAADDDAYDLYMGHAVASGKAALAGYFYNWYDIKYMDFTKPWFPQFAIENLTLNDRMYMTVADMCLSFISNTYCMFFNKQMAADYDIGDIYGLVRDGKWTVDTLTSLTKELYTDLNGDNKIDENDLFGFVSDTPYATPTWLFACDVPTVEFHADGTVTSVFNSERAVRMLDQIKYLYNQSKGSYTSLTDWDIMQRMFQNGQCLFWTGTVGVAESVFRSMDIDYGIIPYPKLEEAQEHYYTVPGGSISALAVPAAVRDTDFVGAITQALCRESWVSVMPVYYDLVLKGKGARDEESLEMLDLLMDSRTLSTSFLYDAWSGYHYTLRELITSNKELASYCTSKDKAVIRHYEKVAQLFFED